jgi:hypothetical protein
LDPSRQLRRTSDDEDDDSRLSFFEQHGGTEMKTMGDGFTASFGSVTKAVEPGL